MNSLTRPVYLRTELRMMSALHKFPVGNWGLDDKLNPSNIYKYHNFIEIRSGIYLLFQFKSKTSLLREIAVLQHVTTGPRPLIVLYL